MALDPPFRALIDQMEASGAPPLNEQPLDIARAGYGAMRDMFSGPQPALPVIKDVTVSGAAGQIKARIYDTVDAQNRPTMVFYHGGGFVIGDLETHDTLCRQLALDGGFRVIAIDYRLAPEHKFPAAADDAIAALGAIGRDAAAYGVDPARIAVGGDSAGGNLAAVAARFAANHGAKLAMQALIYPVTDMQKKGGTRDEFATGYFLTRDGMDWFDMHYTGGGPVHDERLSPLLFDVPKGLCPAYVITAGFDPLRDEGRDYAEKMKKAGVDVTYVDYGTQIHGFFNMPAVSTVARHAIKTLAETVRAAMG